MTTWEDVGNGTKRTFYTLDLRAMRVKLTGMIIFKDGDYRVEHLRVIPLNNSSMGMADMDKVEVEPNLDVKFLQCFLWGV